MFLEDYPFPAKTILSCTNVVITEDTIVTTIRRNEKVESIEDFEIFLVFSTIIT